MEQLLLDVIVISFAKTNVSLLQKSLWPISTVLKDFIQQAKEKALAEVPCQTHGQSQSVYANSLRAYSAPVSVRVHHHGLWKICLGSFKVNLAFAENTEGWSLNLNSTKVLSSQRSWICSLGEISFVFSISISWDLCLRNQVGFNDIFISVSFSQCSVKHADPLILNSVDRHCWSLLDLWEWRRRITSSMPKSDG